MLNIAMRLTKHSQSRVMLVYRTYTSVYTFKRITKLSHSIINISHPLNTNTNILAFFSYLSLCSLAVTIHFRPVANAGILQDPKIRAPAARPFSVLAAHLRARLKLAPSEGLYLYINSAFLPAPDAVIGDLYGSFAVGGELTVNYALMQAWG